MRVVLAANAEADQPWVVDAVAQLAKQTDIDVEVVSVDELEVEALAPLPRDIYRERAEQAAAKAVERLASAGVPASKTVRSGRALEGILTFSEERQADLIVVGSSTRGPLASRLLGNVPLGLMERSRRPVLVVTHPSGGEA